jgi:hypothetical protein
LGLAAVLTGVLLRPRRFFESVKSGEVGVRPFWVYLVVLVLAAASAGVTVGRLADQPIVAMALIVGATQLLVAPIGWFFEVRITHWAARLLRGEGTLQETKAAVGFSSVPQFLSLVPYGGFAGVLWAVVIKIQALRVLHALKLGRAVVAGIVSMTALLVLPIGIAMGLRLFVLEAFKVPAGSMFPSIQIGDHLFVTKSWVLGDNRNNSSDSRAWDRGQGAGVPFQKTRGRARWLWLPPERIGVDLASAPTLPANLSQLAPDLARCLAAAPDLEHTRPPPPPATN